VIEDWDGSEVRGEGGDRQQVDLLTVVVALAETILFEESPQNRIYGRVKPLRYLLGPGLPPIALKDIPSVALVSSLIPARIQITFGLYYQPADTIFILLVLTKGEVVVRVPISKCSQAVTGPEAQRVTGPTVLSMDLPSLLAAMKQSLESRHAAEVVKQVAQQEMVQADPNTVTFKTPIPLLMAPTVPPPFAQVPRPEAPRPQEGAP
jgi:hypothetical protein